MKIVIFGTGGVGGIVGALLAKHGQDVCFVARGAHLRAIQQNGLRIESSSGSFEVKPAKASSDPKEFGIVDLVIVCVKTWQLPAAISAMAPLVGPNTLILPLENGVSTSEELCQVFPTRQVLRGLCAMVSFVDSPGVIRHFGPDPFVAIGEMKPGKSERIEKLFHELSVPGLRLKQPLDIQASQWQKFLFIASFGVITSLVRLPLGIARTTPGTRELVVGAMKEVEKTARALGVQLPPDAIQKGLELVDEMPEDGTTSMQRDFMAGRRTELEAFSGYIFRKAEELGLEAPIHKTCYHLLLPLELKARQS